ncbi:hypothetical protein RB195_018910 [Necator americanus]|uniref:Endonuclease/exonuclease/phosphatase domain-containing protein n=2 Tax=Necator americanus TaxID=51031 RepID=A0ABR1CBR6_NECAM
MAKASHTLQKGAVVQHTTKAHNLKGQLPEGSMESLATNIRFVTLNCRTLSSELQQAALSRLLRYLCVPFAALQETRMRDRPVISIENYTIYCGDADENKVDGCAIAVRNDYKNLVEEFGSTSSRCAFLRLRDRRGCELWIVSAHAPTETAEDYSKDAFYDELNALISEIPSQQVVIVGIDANAKMRLEQQSNGLGKWYYAAERTTDNGDRLVTSTFKRNHRRHQLTWQGSTLLTPEEQRKRKMRTLKLQLDYVLARNIPQSDIRKSRAVWDVAFDSDHRPVLLSFKIRFHKRNRGVHLQPKIDMEKRLRRKLRRQLQQDRDDEWTSKAMEFEKAWEDRNPRKAYALLKQYSGKMKRCSHVLNTANGVAVGEANLLIWKEHFKILLNRLAPSAPRLEHVHRPTYAVNEEPPTESEVLVCIQKMKNGKSGGNDGISAEMLKFLPPSGIREMTKIIRSIWIDERIPDSWKHAITIPLHKKLSVTDPRNYRGISLLRVMYKVLERIILNRLIKKKKQRATSKLAFVLADLRLTGAFDSPHRGRLLNALRADGVPGKFVRLLDDMNQQPTDYAYALINASRCGSLRDLERESGVCHNEGLYAEIDVVYQRMTRARYQHLAPLSKAAKVNRLRFFGHILRRSADRLVQRVLKSSSGSSLKKPSGRKRKFWTEVVKEDLKTLGVDRQFRRDVRFRRTWNSDEWIDSVQALAEDREGWAELCSRTAHLSEDAGNRVRR